MKQKIYSVANILSIGLILCGIYIFLFIHPFIYSYIGIIEQGKTNTRNIKWDKLAVQYSIFKPQKKFTINSAIPGLILNKEYDTAINYFKQLENLGLANDKNYYLASFAYEQTKDYENALKYAKKSNDKLRETRVYIKMKDFDNAQKLVDDLSKEKPLKPRIYLYQAELYMGQNKWKEANITIDKFLKINPKSVEALQDKARISRRLGNLKAYRKYMKISRLIEIKLGNRIN